MENTLKKYDLKSHYNEYLNEYLAVLSKLAEMAFMLGTDYKYFLDERERRKKTNTET